jgi:radical SAM superfamily enzyme YgiQ (UPF0313 family)
MKKIGIITLTRQNSLAYIALRRIVQDLGYTPVCGEAIGADCLFFPLEELALIGHDFLGDFFEKAGLSDVDTILISAPYTANLFVLPKVIWCLKRINSAPIILGGNEASNNYKNLMLYRFSTFANKVIDIAPDFIVRGSAENALPSLLPLLDKTTITKEWDKDFLKKLLEIPNIVFWLPEKKALVSTEFSAEDLSERDIFSFVRYGQKTIAITLQRACAWAKKSRGGCLFCSIASQFGNDFHCAVQSDFFVEDLSAFLRDNPEIRYVDIWDDTFNISVDWAVKICGYLKILNKEVGREIRYTCFLRPKGLNEELVREMREANIKAAFVGADALSEGLSKRLRRGCTVAELNKSIETLGKGRIQPNLSLQLFTPESVIDDVGMTATVALSGIKNGKSTVHVHLYTFPLFGSDMFGLLEARNNLDRIPSPLLRKEKLSGFVPYLMAYGYMNYDPDVEEIKQKTYKLLDVSTSFYVKTYPGDNIDGSKLKKVLKEVRTWCIETKKTHKIKSLWYMIILLLEKKGRGMKKEEVTGFLSRKDSTFQIPEKLRGPYGDFGYRHTLSRSFNEVIDILIKNGWVRRTNKKEFRLASEGIKKLKLMVGEAEERHLNIAAYGKVEKTELLKALDDL